MLAHKTIVLGITGSIAAYKAADIASKLTQAKAKVEVVMTPSATRFITPLTLRNITGRPVISDMWDENHEFRVEHIALAEAADAVVIAPATANIIAKLKAGIADDMLTCVVLATRAPVVIAPAMNDNMFSSPVTRDNLSKLKSRGFTIINPDYGRLASGKIGQGRLAEVTEILGVVERVLGGKDDLKGRRIVITAGGTREPIDPVRYISNRSSGKMGYALAEAARDRGAEVKLVSSATLPEPDGISLIQVETAEEMKRAVKEALLRADALIMAAAVSDYKPSRVQREKIKKDSPALNLKLEKTPDILAEVQGGFLKIGFAAESQDLLKNARGKLEAKDLDMIVANDITRPGSGFGSDTNKVTLLFKDGEVEELPVLPKREVADKILDRVARLLPGKS